MQKRVLLLASQGDEAERIAAFGRRLFDDFTALHGNWGEPLPQAARDWQGDLVISYCSRWIVPEDLLRRAGMAINFHPAPPEFPGIGGLNWALYESRETFGVTCHEMTPVVDAGRLLEIRRFPLLDRDDVEELFRRTHAHLECLAYDVLAGIYNGTFIGSSDEKWSPVARKRKELDAMMTINRTMTDEEIARRKRAFEFSSWTLQYAD